MAYPTPPFPAMPQQPWPAGQPSPRRRSRGRVVGVAVGIVLLVLAVGGGMVWVASDQDGDTTASASPGGVTPTSPDSDSVGGEYDAVSDACAVDLSSLSDWVDPLPSGESNFDDTSDVRAECVFADWESTTGFSYARIDASVFGDGRSASAALEMFHSADTARGQATCPSSEWTCVEEDATTLGDQSYGFYSTGYYMTGDNKTTMRTYTYQLTVTDDNLLLTVDIDFDCEDDPCVDSTSLKEHTVELTSAALESVARG